MKQAAEKSPMISWQIFVPKEPIQLEEALMALMSYLFES